MTIVNRLVPICQFGGPCEKVGEGHLKAMMQQIDTDTTRTTGQSLHSIITGRELLRCGNCNKYRDLKTCRQCRKVSYCSKERQRQHWKMHKRDCTPASSCAT